MVQIVGEGRKAGLNYSDDGVAYTIVNSAFAVSGSNIGSMEFVRSGGARGTHQFVEGDNLSYRPKLVTARIGKAAYRGGA